MHDFTHNGLSMTWPQLDLDPQDIGRLFLLILQHSRIAVRRLALNGIDEIGFLQISSLSSQSCSASVTPWSPLLPCVGDRTTEHALRFEGLSHI